MFVKYEEFVPTVLCDFAFDPFPLLQQCIKHEDEALDLHKYNWVPHGMQIFNHIR
jgi:hypothetical protein